MILGLSDRRGSACLLTSDNVMTRRVSKVKVDLERGNGPLGVTAVGGAHAENLATGG